MQSREIQLLADTALASNQNERIQQKEAEIAALRCSIIFFPIEDDKP